MGRKDKKGQSYHGKIGLILLRSAYGKRVKSPSSSPRSAHDYNAKYDALVSSYEVVKKRRDEVAGEIRQKGIRRREFARFIAAVEKLPNEVTEFEESMWSDLVESMTVYAKDDIRFILPCETEIKA